MYRPIQAFDFLRTSTLLLLSMLGAARPLSAVDIDFARDVRPILSDKCYACHGPDESHREAGLHFDTKAGAFVDLGGHFAIQAHKPDESELIRRINASGDEAMPPPEHPKRLTEHEKSVLLEWIQQGAEWRDHWAYVPPARASLPATSQTDWAINFIDAFVLVKLEGLGHQPSPPADRVTLMRRLSFDLNGLPPSPEEVQEFLNDKSQDAYEAVVDRLLKSPHFGERMAMVWLDLVRYADTVGYHGDQDMSVSPYRDYVIQAFNSNLPFDQFTREQLAGDLLDHPTRDQLVASGYNRIGMMSAEGGVQPEEYLVKYASDRVRTASVVWLGSTLGCAECHNHKFDPFTAKDFYQFSAFFADIKEQGLYSGPDTPERWGPIVEVPDLELDALLAPLDAEIQQLTTMLNHASEELQLAQAEWETATQQALAEWHVLRPTKAEALHKTALKINPDASVLASGANPNQNTYTLTMDELPNNLERITALRLDVLPDDSLPQRGPGRAGNGNFVISEVRASIVDANGELRPIKFHNASASIEQSDSSNNPYQGWKAAAAIDDDVHGPSWGWAILPEVGKANSLVLPLVEELSSIPQAIVVTIEQNHSNPKHTLGKFRLAVTGKKSDLVASQGQLLANEIGELLLTDPASRTKDQRDAIAEAFRSVAPQLAGTRDRLAHLQKERAASIVAHTRTSLVTESVQPREIRVLKRGNWMDKTGEIVLPAVPHFLRQLDQPGSATRLDLANWITSADNPLTSRVFVNRLWKMFFGTGLSKQLDDFGAQGEPPSHAELLDALAVEFVESGWNIRHMIKLIVMSQAYRQSSMPRDQLKATDPYNRLLARQSRFRLDAEMIRDNALAVSGLLVRDIGGGSVKPYQPDGLYRHLNFPPRTYQADSDSKQYRRGVYTHWQRQFLHPAMQAFDAPAREECTAERPRSNTPLAALVLLNDPSYVEAARVLATHALTPKNLTSDQRIDWLFQCVLSRAARPEEKSVLEPLLQSQQQQYSLDTPHATEFISIGNMQPTDNLAAAELAAWTALARVVLNLHETITRN